MNVPNSMKLLLGVGLAMMIGLSFCGPKDTGEGEAKTTEKTDGLDEIMTNKVKKAIGGYDFEFTSNLLSILQKKNGQEKPVKDGKFAVGTNDPSNLLAYPRHEVQIKSFVTVQYPILNSQYEAFIANSGYSNKANWSEEGWAWKTKNKVTKPKGWENYKPDNKLQRLYPVTGVSYYEAEAFCRSLTQTPDEVLNTYCKDAKKAEDPYCVELKQGIKEFAVRLPNEFELEVAATNGDVNVYPWGTNKDAGDIQQVGRLQSAASQPGVSKLNEYGLQDLTGTVYQWTISNFELYPGNDTGYSNPKIGDKNYVVLRGSAYDKVDYATRAQYRLPMMKSVQDPRIGFRFLIYYKAKDYITSKWIDVTGLY